MKKFKEYLVSKFGKDEAELNEMDTIETVVSMDGSEANRIVVFYMRGFLSLSVFYGSFERKHFKAMCAFIDDYNERADRKYELRYLNGQLWVEVDAKDVDGEKAVAIVEDILRFFAEDGEVATAVNTLMSDAKERWSLVGKRVKILTDRARELDTHGYHKEAMGILEEICELYYGFKHMELVALQYQHDVDKAQSTLRFPCNKEYALECLLTALEQVKDDVFMPMMAYRLAKELGNDEVATRMEALAHQNGAWEYLALKSSRDPMEDLQRIARYYREGIGCEVSKRNAAYYDRLAAGEREAVFKDMLMDGFEPVFKLMGDKAYYPIQSLAELDGVSDEFKRRYLYGDESSFKLPDWFVPLVNGLNEADREVVLAATVDRMQHNMDAFLSRVQSGEVEVVLPVDSNMGVTIETEDGWKYVYAPDLKGLVDCDAKEKLPRVFAKFQGLN